MRVRERLLSLSLSVSRRMESRKQRKTNQQMDGKVNEQREKETIIMIMC